ncbi:MAG: hypothetical protein JXQ82_10560 [Methanomicrobiaceae archaeon]|nr:hypothetical protein [Methanomicrobiaceae archaeon]
MTQGNKGINTDQLVKIMTLAIIATLVLTISVGVLYLIQNILPQTEGDTFLPSDAGIYHSPQTDSQTITPYQNSPAIKSDTIISLGSETGMKDSASLIEHFIPDDPYYSQTKFNNTPPPEYTAETEQLQTLYEESFTMLYTPISIKASAGKGPLIIDYSVANNLGDDKNPFYSFLTINITDFETGEVVGKGGYGREYSIEEEQSIKIPRTGDFRIDIYGSGIDLDLKVMSGIESDLTSAIPPQKTNTEEYPEDMWW